MEQFINSRENPEEYSIIPGSTGWRSPSNIAIIKYWGKHGNQLPRNPSLSFTLTSAYTETRIQYKPIADNISPAFSFRFEGVENPAFSSRIQKYLSHLEPYFPFLGKVDLAISSGNSFPHSSGIASSASAMSALAFCLCSMEAAFTGKEDSGPDFLRKASFIARLGSGSACRSVYPGIALWGRQDQVHGSSDLFALPMGHILHPVFGDFRDTILLVSSGQKKVSSSAGHSLMDNNPYATIRYQNAGKRLSRLIDVIEAGDLNEFGNIAEAEALELHALMMASSPPFILMLPDTLAIIHALHKFRADTGYPVYFTLDAGPNIHLLYPARLVSEVNRWLEAEIAPLIEGRIEDAIGKGPVKISSEFASH